MYTGLIWLLVVFISLPAPCVSVTQLEATPKDTYIFSPSYPQQYGDNIEESWLLVASDPSHVIHLEVIDSQIEASASCLYDFVQVHDGQNASAPVIGKFCGISTPSYVTSGTSMYVLFKTDSSGGQVGFYIKYFSSLPPSTLPPSTTQDPISTTTAPLDSTTLSESRLGASTTAISSTSIIGILIAVAFFLTVIVIIIVIVCVYNSKKKSRIEPRKRPNEDEVWKKICSTPRRPILKPDGDISSRSAKSGTSVFSTNMTPRSSSGTYISPRQKSVSFRLNQDDYVIHSLQPVRETQHGASCYDDVDGKHLNSPTSRYAHLDMMELSPRRLQPIQLPEDRYPTSLTSYASGRMNQLPKVKIADETRRSNAISPRGSNQSQGLPNALKKARETRRARNINRVKSVEAFSRGHMYAKTSVSRIDLVRSGILREERTSVPRVPTADVRRNVNYHEYDVIGER